MEMQTNIRDEIKRMTKIQLKQDNFIGKGAYASVYRYNIHNTQLSVKCFENFNQAKEENAILQKIYGLIPNCPSIVQYYGTQKLDIEIIGQCSYKGYAIFFEACLLDFEKLFAIVKKLQTKEALNLQTFILQLIKLFNQPMHINILQQIPYFQSDILINPLYSSIILTLFEGQNIQLSKIHAQFNIQNEFDCEAFHQDCNNKGSTLLIMQSNDEPYSFFGGMVAPLWNSKDIWMADPVNECS